MVQFLYDPGTLDPNFFVVAGSGVESDPWKGIYHGYYPNINGVTQFPFLTNACTDDRVYRITQLRVHWNGAAGVTISPTTATMLIMFPAGFSSISGWPSYTTTGLLYGDNFVWDTPLCFRSRTGMVGGLAAQWTATNTPIIVHLGAGAGLNDDLALYIEADIWTPQPLITTPPGLTPVSVEAYKWPLQRRV